MGNELITLDDIAKMYRTSRRWARDVLVKRPDFPRPALSMSQKTRRWRLSDVQHWITTKATR